MPDRGPSRDSAAASYRAARDARLTSWLSRAVSVMGVAILAVGLSWPSWRMTGTYWRFPGQWLVVGAVVLVAVSRLRGWRRPQRQLLLSIASATLLVLVLAGLRPVDYQTKEWVWGGATRNVSPQGDWEEPHMGANPEYGSKATPNLTARQHHRDFDVTYHTDAEGWRLTPAPHGAGPHPEVWFLGCSFTWGLGVEDTEAFPAILAREAWTDLRVRNLSCSGWGTIQASLVLDEMLRRGVPPRAVFYGYMLHARRNYLRRSWRRLANTPFPFFELHAGQPVYRGLREADFATREDGPQLDRDEMELTVKLLAAMNDRCRQQGIPFVILIFEDDGLQASLTQSTRVASVSLEKLWPDVFPHDGHPGPEWHRLVAHALANSPVLAQPWGVPELHRPGTVSLGQVDLARLHLFLAHGAAQVDAQLAESNGTWRVDGIECPPQEAWRVQLVRWQHHLRAGEQYVLSFEARAETSRSIDVALTNQDLSSAAAFWYQTMPLTAAWKSFRFELRCPEETSAAALGFRLGGAMAPVELRRITCQDRQGQLVLPRPPLISRLTVGTPQTVAPAAAGP